MALTPNDITAGHIISFKAANPEYGHKLSKAKDDELKAKIDKDKWKVFYEATKAKRNGVFTRKVIHSQKYKDVWWVFADELCYHMLTVPDGYTEAQVMEDAAKWWDAYSDAFPNLEYLVIVTRGVGTRLSPITDKDFDDALFDFFAYHNGAIDELP